MTSQEIHYETIPSWKSIAFRTYITCKTNFTLNKTISLQSADNDPYIQRMESTLCLVAANYNMPKSVL